MRFGSVIACASLILILSVESGRGVGPVQSGPQVGEKVPGPFLPLNVTGPDAGKKACLVCRYGPRPVVMIFAREISPELLGLLTKIDATTAAHTEQRLASFVVFCSQDEGLPVKLAQAAKEANLSQTILATFDAAGPPRYKINPEADVSVVLYHHSKVEANYVYRKGELTAVEVDKILKDLPKILANE